MKPMLRYAVRVVIEAADVLALLVTALIWLG